MRANRRPVHLTIRFRLVALAAACVLPAWVAAALMVHHSYQDRRALIERHMIEMARALSLSVDRDLTTIQASLQAMAASPVLAMGDLAAFRPQAETVTRQFDAISIVLSDHAAMQVVNTLLPPEAPLRRRPVPDAVAQVFATGQPVITGLWVGQVSGRAQFGVEVPVRRDGAVAFDLGMNVPAERLVPILRRGDLPAGGIKAILDTSGVVVARFPGQAEFVGRVARSPLLARMAEADEGITEIVSYEGVPETAAFARSEMAGWTVVIGVPTATLMAELRQWLWWTLASAVLLSTVGVALALLVGRTITGAIGSLVAPALALGRGEPVTATGDGLLETDEVAAALVRASELLRRREAERDKATRELAEREATVRHQAEDLRQSNADLEQFAYVSSHDLREPLRMVSSYVSLLERRYADKLDDEAREFIGYAKDGAHRMDRLILDLLDFSRVGRCGGPPGPVALGDALADALANLKLPIEEAGARVIVPQTLPVVFAERAEMVRLLQNLIGNAVKYRSPDRPPEVVVSAASEGDFQVVSVKDNGIGIAPEFFERIFGLFQRLHPRDRYEGTGIGLALCKKIAERHGGRIRVRSTPGEGSEFLVSLPAVPPAPPEDEAATSPPGS